MAKAVNPAEDKMHLCNNPRTSVDLRGFSLALPMNFHSGIFKGRKEDILVPSQKVLENKKAIVAQLTERFQNAQAGVLADYRGLTVEQDTALRVKLREAGVEYTVVKNNLTRFAANEAGLSELDEVLHGPTAIATSNDDVVAPAKVLCDFAKDNEALEIKGGFVDGKVISLDEVKTYASIPSKEVLISKMLGSLLSPIGALARTLQAIVDEEAVPGATAGKEAEEAAPAEEAPAVEEAAAEEAPATEEAAPAEEAPAAEEAAPAEEPAAE